MVNNMISNSKNIGKSRRKEQITLTLSNQAKISVHRGITIRDFIKEKHLKFSYPPVIAKVNNKLTGLTSQLFDDVSLSFIDLTTNDGKLCYQRSLSFLLVAAVEELFKNAKIKINHSLCKGFYCEIIFDPPRKISFKDVELISQKMNQWVEEDREFVRKETDIDQAIKIFEERGQKDKARLLAFRKNLGDKKVSIYEFDGHKNHFYGYLVPSSGYLKTFELRYYPPGLLLRFPRKSNPQIIPDFIEQVKLFTIYKEYSNWGKILGVQSVADLNDIIAEKKIDEFILIAEALHEKKIAEIADKIKSRIVHPKLILISGPSSSGKTTFSKRLAIQLSVLGIKPFTISLDNYFVNREQTPKDEFGELDFESIEAIDSKLFNANVMSLLGGEKIRIPKYDFKSGMRKEGTEVKLDENQVIIVEGIHGLNRQLTEAIPDAVKFKIYVSALTMLNLDMHNRISTTDTRLIRRIVRDNAFRGYAAINTIKRWDSVSKGEEKFIFPYQERADVMFNTALVYELAILKKFAEPLLKAIDQSEPEYSEATRLLKFLTHFKEINPHNVPKTSIIREFIGGSAFIY